MMNAGSIWGTCVLINVTTLQDRICAAVILGLSWPVMGRAVKVGS